MAMKPKRRVRRRSNGEGGGGIVLLLFVLIVVLAVFRWQVAAVAGIFLLPTFVLAITGKGPNLGDKIFCVAFMNMSGVAPYAMQVWDRPSNFTYVVTDPINVTVMFGAAAVGYLVLYVGPMLAAMVLQAMAQDNLKKLAAQKQSIVDAWGNEVAAVAKEPEKSNFIARKR